MKNEVDCTFRVKKRGIIIFFILCALSVCAEEPLSPNPLTTNPLTLSLDDVVLDIYNAVTELGEIDYEQLQTDLYAIHESPIDLNHTSDEELSLLHFLSLQQIDDILAYADRHPFQSLYELRMIQSLTDYEIRDLLPFVTITDEKSQITNDKLNAKDVFHGAKHELIARVDARNIEAFEGTDPVYVQTRYRFDYQRRVTFGVQLRRPVGGIAKDLQYGAYIQLRDIGCLHTLVAGNFQASFGQGLVLAPVFRSGKSAYVQSVGQTTEGLRYYSSVDGEGLHGIGTTFRHQFNASTRLDISALYSLKRANDSTWHHVVGANLTLRHKKLQVGLTAIENIWQDTIHPYRNTAYNTHYFRGKNQAVIGANIRYNHGWFDAFAEVATAQNYQSSISNYQLREAHWGFGLIAGSRFYPTQGISLIALYRYYSPFFDNALGYAFSETSRLGDENGGFLGFDITRLKNWRFSGYADVFYFSGPKYGIPQSPTLGYDAMAEMQYHSPMTNYQSPITNHQWSLSLRLRARKKGDLSTYSARFQWTKEFNNGSFRMTAETNLTPNPLTSNPLTYAFTIYQDLAYNFQMANGKWPISFHLRLQAFDARNWDNRIYCYEHDVLYAFSIPAVYGLGGRAYLSLKWQIIPQLALYFRASETIYARDWYIEKYPQSPITNHPLQLPTRTDLHLLLRATL